jgi:flavin reductase (DIM6/NTAB) family NADH-FMN oxidoreductase RutF
MGKTKFKPGNMLYPLPAVMVSCGDINGVSNILTIAWTGTLCTNPPMAYIAVRPERHSYDMIRDSGEFVINLTTKKLVRATDFCGVRSGRSYDKWSDCHLTPVAGDTTKCPMIGESPVNIECKVRQILELGSHHVFVADVTSVHVDDRFLDRQGTFHLEDAGLIAYSHGTYFDLGKALGSFGYSIQKKKTPSKKGKSRPSSKSNRAAYDKKKGGAS